MTKNHMSKIKSIAEIMQAAMSASDYSYYKSRQPLGQDGDFVTAPEISQMFGEMIGIWALYQWEKLGSPLKFNLVELGPGRGFLMRDLLRATLKQISFQKSAQIHLLDINPILMLEQKKQLKDYAPCFISKISDLPALPTIIIANEFFDALPIRQYIKKNNKWYEIKFIMQENNHHELVYSDITLEKEHWLNDNHPNAEEGGIFEESLESLEIMTYLANHIKKYQGAALIIDYGYDISPLARSKDQYKPTLQAIKDHKFHPIFENLGKADLSAHVDFYAMKSAALKEGLKVNGAISQRDLLMGLGIDLRLERLIQQNPELEEILKKQYHRLIAKDTMGELFKAIIIESIIF